jgi:hypothetical protein
MPMIVQSGVARPELEGWNIELLGTPGKLWRRLQNRVLLSMKPAHPGAQTEVPHQFAEVVAAKKRLNPRQLRLTRVVS